MNDAKEIHIDFKTRVGFTEFLRSNKISLVVSTYQTGNVFFMGPGEKEGLKINLIKMKRPMGLTVHKNSIFIGTQYQIVKFNNLLPQGVIHEQADRLYVPQQIWVTGDQDSHDIVIEDDNRIVFVNTLHSCLATLDGEHSFVPVWTPPNITEVKHEDRCHLNGVALRNGKIAYATAFSKSNTKEGWRKEKDKGGVVWDITKNKVVLAELTMPHSPRWYADKLWVLESGTGTLATVDLEKNKLVPFMQLPGYLRGLTFYKQFAFIGSSVPRANSVINHLALSEQIEAQNTTPTCGVFVIDITTGQLIQFVRIISGVQEIYDLAVLANCHSPKAIDLDSKEIGTTVSIGR